MGADDSLANKITEALEEPMHEYDDRGQVLKPDCGTPEPDEVDPPRCVNCPRWVVEIEVDGKRDWKHSQTPVKRRQPADNETYVKLRRSVLESWLELEGDMPTPRVLVDTAMDAVWPEIQRIAKLGIEGINYLEGQQAMPDDGYQVYLKELEAIVYGK